MKLGLATKRSMQGSEYYNKVRYATKRGTQQSEASNKVKYGGKWDKQQREACSKVRYGSEWCMHQSDVCNKLRYASKWRMQQNEVYCKVRLQGGKVCIHTFFKDISFSLAETSFLSHLNCSVKKADQVKKLSGTYLQDQIKGQNLRTKCAQGNSTANNLNDIIHRGRRPPLPVLSLRRFKRKY